MTASKSDGDSKVDEPVIGRRQQGIAERRRKLVRAAGELIVEKENGNFSMPELAARAGVSLATPYNLFGSKAAVLSHLLEGQVRGFYRDSPWLQDPQPVARVLAAVERLVSVYASQPLFFQNLVRALYGLAPGEQGQVPFPAGAHLVQPLVQSLARDGWLTADVPIAVVEITLTRLFDATFERCALQSWSPERLRADLRASFALVFAGLLGPDHRDRLVQAMTQVRAD